MIKSQVTQLSPWDVNHAFVQSTHAVYTTHPVAGIEKKRDYISVTFIIVYCYNYSISLLIIIVHLLLCLVYKLNFIIDMLYTEIHSIHRTPYYQQFQASTGSLGLTSLCV
jgi:hypothetical protein